MQKNFKMAFSGAGNMAGAMIDAILKAKLLLPEQIYIYDTNSERIEFYKSRGLNICSSNSALAKTCDMIVLAVKPQVISSVLEDIKDYTQGKCVVSIAAGVTVARIKKALGDGTYVVRILPNTPMLVLQGATVIAEPENVPEEEFNFICSVFRAAGQVTVLPEDKINAVIPVSSSSPAFFFRMAAAMASAGEVNGIDYDVALKLAAATMLGSAHVILETEKTPEELIRQVSSPGGTTVAALTAFDEIDFEKFIEEAFSRCIKRADELGRGL